MQKAKTISLTLAVISWMLAAFGFQFPLEAEPDNRGLAHELFETGEVIEYRLTYGIFNLGKAETRIFNQLYNINDRTCYKVEVKGRTTGMVDWVAKVDDMWGAFVDTERLIPHVTYRDISEGKYTKKEFVRFNHKKQLIEVKTFDKDKGEYKDPVYYDSPKNVKDIISGFMYLRTLDFSDAKKGDIFSMHTFFEDTIYHFRFTFEGKEQLKTKIGRLRTFKLKPIMPDNKIFDGENAVSIWLTDDKNKIPVKVEASMFIGNAGVEITGFQNLKHDLNYDR